MAVDAQHILHFFVTKVEQLDYVINFAYEHTIVPIKYTCSTLDEGISNGGNSHLNSMPFCKKIIVVKPIVDLHTSIMSNVHGTPISRFPPKELGDIDQHQCSIHKHRICDSAIHFILQSFKGINCKYSAL
jgi:hypothetical protein